ncbi:zinc-dependent peptidase [Halothiobacillus sp.]|uniref:M90 family metallopeptidase n=1 Tax=Halothiobacillus sp. TaxID=1891311 RepID=UPI003D0BE069
MFNQKHPIPTLIPRWRLRRLIKKHPIAHHLWKSVTRRIRLLDRLDSVERAQLRAMVIWFLAHKTIWGADGLTVTAQMKLVVATLACLPVLKLGFSYLDGWSEVILYPGAFRVSHARSDEFGLVHDQADALSGESWLHGPLVLSWEDVRQNAFRPQSGRNVVIHEIAHKLDGLNGAMNGMPPLHRTMIRENWTQSFTAAFQHLQQQLAAGQQPDINPYAATDPAEFFAVVSEYFFTAPQVLVRHHPELYRQLAGFYRQQTK